MGASQKLMIYFMENSMKMDDLGVPHMNWTLDHD